MSEARNILYVVCSCVSRNDDGYSSSPSSGGLIKTCLLKLNMCENSSPSIPALRKFILETSVSPRSFSFSSIIAWGIEGQAFEIMIRFAGVMNLRICMSLPPMFIQVRFSSNLSTVFTSSKKIQTLWLESREMNLIHFGPIKLPIAFM